MSRYRDKNHDDHLASFLPSTEESLQQWLSRNVPTPDLQSTCPCCTDANCARYAPVYDSMRKLEDDTRLAAEIGQDLLVKHEALLRDSRQTKDILEQQISDGKLKVATLEQLLEEMECAKQELQEEKDRVTWQWQKSQKSLQETALELDRVNERCMELGNELKHQSKQVERLRIFKVMARDADGREDALRLQLDDTTRELAMARKNSLLMECKYKKLKANYDMMCASLKCKDHDPEDPVPSNWLPKLRPSTSTKDHATGAAATTTTASRLQTPLSSSAPLSTIHPHVKDQPTASTSSSTTNTAVSKKDEVVHYHFHYMLPDQQQRLPLDPMSSCISANTIPFSSTASVSSMSSYCGCPSDDPSCAHQPSSSSAACIPPPTTSFQPSAWPRLQQLQPSQQQLQQHLQQQQQQQQQQHPYASFYTRACQLLDRLQGTDVRTLNRRLRQTFDMIHVAGMSNTLLESILVDVGQLAEEDDVMVQLGQRMLKEIGQLRMTMNDLQTDYVKKVTELEAWVEQDIIRRKHQQSTPNPQPLAALSFLLLSPPPPRSPSNHNNPSTAENNLRRAPMAPSPAPSRSIPTIRRARLPPSTSLDHLLDDRHTTLGFTPNWLTKNKEHPFVMV